MICLKVSKRIAWFLTAAAILAALSACATPEAAPSTDSTRDSSGIVCITLPGNTASEAYPAQQAEFEALTGHRFEYTIWSYDSDFFRAQFETAALPTLYPMGSIGLQKMIQNGYCRDITPQVQARGWDTDMLPVLKDTVSDEDGRIYGVPISASALGLVCNVAVFRAAGLVDDRGVPVYPKTWDELVETCKTITEKTGAAGIALSASSNTGSMYWANIAWNYGAELCTKNEDGSFTSRLNTPEAVEAMQVYKRLAGAGVVYGDPCLDDAQAACDAVASGLAAMAFGFADTAARLALPPEEVAVIPLPAGPGGAYMLVTGSYWCFSPDATDQEVDAALDYIELYSTSPAWNETREAILRQQADNAIRNGLPYLTSLPCYDGISKTHLDAIAEAYPSEHQDRFRDYNTAARDTSRLRGEEPGETQQMYALIASVIQEIFVNPDADVQMLMDTIQSYYQTILDSYAALE